MKIKSLDIVTIQNASINSWTIYTNWYIDFYRELILLTYEN